MHLRIQRGGGGTGGLDHPRKSQKYRSFSNTGPDPLKIVKLPSQLSIFGHNRLASKTPFKWRFVGGRKWPPNSGIWIIPPPSS